MIKLYAYYEKSAVGWGLVVYHGGKPPAKTVNGAGPDRVGPYEVPEEMIDIDGSPNMGLIVKAFPAPSVGVYAEPAIDLNQGEKDD